MLSVNYCHLCLMLAAHTPSTTQPRKLISCISMLFEVSRKGKNGLATHASGIYLEVTALRGTPSGSRSTSAVTKADMEATLEEVRIYRDENSHLRDRIR